MENAVAFQGSLQIYDLHATRLSHIVWFVGMRCVYVVEVLFQLLKTHSWYFFDASAVYVAFNKCNEG